ncbi:deazapurine DNA modification protein DpdA family protein [Kineosporia babensis]|uniref:DeoxyPurine in DNA protein A domain-containing protein n=1 Tax=Kineosporia babensis TaxID=499548 RepID=A0A9X1NBW1_9ACTN|nr:hypothetical protein [Kineosporia babensis]MCD5310921.1 hypothetical protein [Kineosporia babensis]
MSAHAEAPARAQALAKTGWYRKPGQPIFYLGAHRPNWLAQSPVPLFVSARTLGEYAIRNLGDNLPKARCIWALDSGGFTELRDFGGWRQGPDEFGSMVARICEGVGMPMFSAIQDWMCEPFVIAGGETKDGTFTGTGFCDDPDDPVAFERAVDIHQELTIDSYLWLVREFPWIHWLPTLQGWLLRHYLRHDAMYAKAGIDLRAAALVGLGSVCRRQATEEIGAIVSTFHAKGYRLHGFGVKTLGLRKYGHMLASADSLAWSYGSRRAGERLPGCIHSGPCNNCLPYAVHRREAILAELGGPAQLGLDLDWESAA